MSFGGLADDDGNRAVVEIRRRASAPVDVVVSIPVVFGAFALISITDASAADALAAAVVVGDQVILPVGRIAAGSHPGYGRDFGSGRAGDRASSTAGAE